MKKLESLGAVTHTQVTSKNDVSFLYPKIRKKVEKVYNTCSAFFAFKMKEN